MTEESISHNAGKVLIQIYMGYTKNDKILHFNELQQQINLDENKLMRALEYCYDKGFLDLEIINFMGGGKSITIKRITADGIDIIEKPAEQSNKRPFNVTFNFNNEFNVDSIIKGEVKLF